MAAVPEPICCPQGTSAPPDGAGLRLTWQSVTSELLGLIVAWSAAAAAVTAAAVVSAMDGTGAAHVRRTAAPDFGSVSWSATDARPDVPAGTPDAPPPP